jgi:hypothetical protein
MDRKTLRISWLAACSLVATSVAAGCGGPPGVDAAQAALDKAIPPSSSLIGARVGQGYDSTTDSFTLQCVRSPTLLHVGQRTASIDLQKTVDSDTVKNELGFDATIKAKYGWLDASLTTKLTSNLDSDDFSELFIYRADYNLGNDSLDENNFALTDVGKSAQQSLQWSQVCGDSFVYQISNGARLYLVYRLEFASKHDKENFTATFGAKISGGVVDLSGGANKLDDSTRKQTKIELSVFQFGGDVTQLSSVVAGLGKLDSDPTHAEARAVVDCDLDHLDACQKVLTNAVAYTSPQTPNGLPQQIDQNPSNPTGYIIKPWTQLALPSVPGVLTAEINAARAQLSDKFDAIFPAKQRVDRLLTLFQIPADQRTELTTWKSKLEKATASINSAVKACFDDLKFDPKNGNSPFPDLVQACVSAVDAIDASVPGADVLDATGAWLISRSAAAQGLTPLAPAVERPGGIYREYGDAAAPVAIFYSVDTGLHTLAAPYYAKYKTLNGPTGALGWPFADPIDSTDGAKIYRFQNGAMYGTQHSTICWTGKRPIPCGIATSVFEVNGAIYLRYLALGENGGFLGLPISDETAGANNGRYNHFANGSIYWTLNTGAHELHGAIEAAWNAAGADASPLGYPRTDVTTGYDGVGAYVDFEGGGIWSAPNIGTFSVRGQIWAKYIQDRSVDNTPGAAPTARYLTSKLGYPTGEARSLPSGMVQRFEHGGILWSANSGAHEIAEPMFTKYWSHRHVVVTPPGQPLIEDVPSDAGYPTADEQVFEKQGEWRVHVAQLQHGLTTFVEGQPAAYFIDGIEYDAYARAGVWNGCLGPLLGDRAWSPSTKSYYYDCWHGRLYSQGSETTVACQ